MLEEKRSVAKSLQVELAAYFSRGLPEPSVEVYSGLRSLKGIFERLLE